MQTSATVPVWCCRLGPADTGYGILPLGVVDDGGVAQEVVEAIYQFLIKCADTGAAERVFFHDTFHVVSGDPVADDKGTLRDDDQAAENISQGILGGEGDGHGADAQGSNESGYIIVPFVGNQDDAKYYAYLCAKVEISSARVSSICRLERFSNCMASPWPASHRLYTPQMRQRIRLLRRILSNAGCWEKGFRGLRTMNI